MKERNK